MLKIENVTVEFQQFKALDNVSCTIYENDFVLILGHNGAGKSTLFDIISGKTKPCYGKLALNGKNITNHSELRRAGYISRVFQNTHSGSVASLTLAENLAMATWKKRKVSLSQGLKSFPRERILNILKPLNLRFEELLNTPIGQLSGGQRQIITFIMATLCEPKILLLDEPTAALDPVSAENLLQFVKDYVKDKKIATLMITHDEQRARHLSNKTWVMDKGSLKEEERN
ncbi:MAG: ATP-binding cassette domain-containing protein [Silvanigrellaceae bacterium]|nr:ATP-binding cassette domain-containing protein [Silvanigrellaceae bacterium]